MRRQLSTFIHCPELQSSSWSHNRDTVLLSVWCVIPSERTGEDCCSATRPPPPDPVLQKPGRGTDAQRQMALTVPGCQSRRKDTGSFLSWLKFDLNDFESQHLPKLYKDNSRFCCFTNVRSIYWRAVMTRVSSMQKFSKMCFNKGKHVCVNRLSGKINSHKILRTQ